MLNKMSREEDSRIGDLSSFMDRDCGLREILIPFSLSAEISQIFFNLLFVWWKDFVFLFRRFFFLL